MLLGTAEVVDESFESGEVARIAAGRRSAGVTSSTVTVENRGATRQFFQHDPEKCGAVSEQIMLKLVE
jgi:hypothetical protein